MIQELEVEGFTSSKDQKNVFEIIESIIINNLKMEEEIEKEAEALIRKHSANYHSDDLNYEILIKRAKYELAKRKGFKL